MGAGRETQWRGEGGGEEGGGWGRGWEGGRREGECEVVWVVERVGKGYGIVGEEGSAGVWAFERGEGVRGRCVYFMGRGTCALPLFL